MTDVTPSAYDRCVTNLEQGVPDEIAESPDTPVIDGQGEGVEATQAEGTDEPPEPEYDYLDQTELGDRYVKLTVDGEEKSVPLNEVLQGYNSNAAATKRFQEAAALKAEATDALNLARAVQSNPGLTMQVLASQAGLTVEQFLNLSPAQQQNVAEAKAAEPEFTDPFERALYEEQQKRIALEQRFEEREQRFIQQEADNALRSAIGELTQRYGASSDDARSVVQQAYDMQVGPEFFPMIFQAQQYQKSQVQSATVAEAQAATAAEDQRRRAAAAQASGVVATGQSVNGTAPVAVAHSMTAEEAISAALDAAGIT